MPNTAQELKEKFLRTLDNDNNTLLESLHILEELITKHRLQSQTEKDGILTEWMAARCDAMCLKIRMVEMQILCDTYHVESVQALKAVSENLQTAVHDHKAELHQVSQALTAYEAVGAGFDEMVSEYAKLRDEVENKRWALTELQQSLEDDG
ncbi:HAUS augmin-like complex subunit 4 [Lingula anatina]|uniref:HAUS augmin-like complex subunit 4 n=1 Tax=Lingula anatina TaxID=7574 RepID=A0A1S3JLQ3_LINAN|nr:HAUS augmin-like complex subunit 4 [Lingula anatina]|eukprot:XP_013410839.1 HAUS augmin-like complex subunit 4 [Lingula anatina]